MLALPAPPGPISLELWFSIVKLTVNGDQRDLADGATVAFLLEELELAGQVSWPVEVNRELVPKARHADHVLADGDRVEVVTLVGGG